MARKEPVKISITDEQVTITQLAMRVMDAMTESRTTQSLVGNQINQTTQLISEINRLNAEMAKRIQACECRIAELERMVINGQERESSESTPN